MHGYKNPFRSVQNLYAGQIDQGVDYSGTGPVYALGTATITYVDKPYVWFPPAPHYIAYRLWAGAAKGFTVYIAECINPKVHVGEVVYSNTVVGKMYSCAYGVETGWAAPHHLPDTAAYFCYVQNHHYSTGASGYGINMSDLLARIGAPPGVDYGPNVCTMPRNSHLPAW